MLAQLGQDPNPMTRRRCTVEHPFGTIMGWMGATHFLTSRLPNVRTEPALYVPVNNIKRGSSPIGVRRLIAEISSRESRCSSVAM